MGLAIVNDILVPKVHTFEDYLAYVKGNYFAQCLIDIFVGDSEVKLVMSIYPYLHIFFGSNQMDMHMDGVYFVD